MNKQDWKDYFYVLKDVWARERTMVFSMVMCSVLEGIQPYVSIVLIGLLIDAAYAGASLKTLLGYALIALGIGGVFAIAMAIFTKLFFQKMEYMLEIQNRTLNVKGLNLDYEYLEDNEVHDMRQRGSCSHWTFGHVGGNLSDLSKFIRAIVTFITAIVIVLPMFFGSSQVDSYLNSWYVSLFFLVVVALLVWVSYKTGLHYKNKITDIEERLAPWENKRKFYLDVLSNGEGQKDLRIYSQEKLYKEEVRQIAEQEKIIADKTAIMDVKGNVILQTVSIIMCFLVYAFAGWKAYLGIISIGSVVTYATSILKLTQIVDELAFRIGEIKGQLGFARDYRGFLSLEQRKYQGTIPVEKRRDNKFQVEFEHVSFKYPGSEEYVIKDLNLSFVIGEKMAIVGKNGSGKTTFIKLLCRLYDVTEGCIKVNGIDIRKYDYDDYCRLFGVVFQDFKIFAFDLGENVAASDKVDEVRAVDALERAGLGERLQELPEGLHTYVGKEYEESGVNFSGGEKQKLSIARAIYKDAPFVIMDEPTAALDPETECEVFAGFDKMVGRKTAIYISHRLASCRFCEDILVFDKGQVVQRGSHEQLEQQEGLYRELWQAQAQYYQ